MPQAVVVIPARWGSTRFPGKVLEPLAGRPLVLRACDIAAGARRVGSLIVATDDERVREVVSEAGFRAEMTPPDLPSGTDRVAAVARTLEAEIVIGLQADEPFLDPRDLDALVSTLSAPSSSSAVPRLATLAFPLVERARWLDPNTVKVVTDTNGRALYFSRSPIPYSRPDSGKLDALPGGDPPPVTRTHLGIYAWQRDALLAFSGLPRSPLELAEGLEQLRALEAGWHINVLPASSDGFGIDTRDDLVRAEHRLAHSDERRTS